MADPTFPELLARAAESTHELAVIFDTASRDASKAEDPASLPLAIAALHLRMAVAAFKEVIRVIEVRS